MARDPLNAVVRLRRLALDEARSALAQSLRVETAAAAAMADADAAIARETAAARSLAADDSHVEAFARWLPQARRVRDAALAALERAGAETARARAMLTTARAATEAAEQMLAARADGAKAEVARREQHALDEIAQQRRRTAQS